MSHPRLILEVSFWSTQIFKLKRIEEFLICVTNRRSPPTFPIFVVKTIAICESLKSKYLGKFCTFTVLQEIYINNFTMCWMSDSSFWFHPLLDNATASGEWGRKAEINELCLTVIRQWGFCVHCIYMWICNSFLRLVPSLTILNSITTYSSQL